MKLTIDKKLLRTGVFAYGSLLGKVPREGKEEMHVFAHLMPLVHLAEKLDVRDNENESIGDLVELCKVYESLIIHRIGLSSWINVLGGIALSQIHLSRMLDAGKLKEITAVAEPNRQLTLSLYAIFVYLQDRGVQYQLEKQAMDIYNALADRYLFTQSTDEDQHKD